MRLRIEVLSAFDDDQPSWEVDTPRQGRSRNHNLHLVLDEELLAKLAVAVVETSVMECDAETKGLFEELVVDLFDCSLEDLRVASDILGLFLVLHLAECDQVTGSQTGLSTGRHEHDHWLAFTELLDVVECRLVHGAHSWAVMFLTKAFKVNLDRHRPDRRPEVEEPISVSTEPLSYIRTVGHCS